MWVGPKWRSVLLQSRFALGRIFSAGVDTNASPIAAPRGCFCRIATKGFLTRIAFFQVLADQGVVAVLLMVLAPWVGLTRLFSCLGQVASVLSFVGLSCWLFMLAAALVVSTLLKTVLQQVVTGYVLAIPWWVASAPSSSVRSNFIGE